MPARRRTTGSARLRVALSLARRRADLGRASAALRPLAARHARRARRVEAAGRSAAAREARSRAAHRAARGDRSAPPRARSGRSRRDARGQRAPDQLRQLPLRGDRRCRADPCATRARQAGRCALMYDLAALAIAAACFAFVYVLLYVLEQSLMSDSAADASGSPSRCSSSRTSSTRFPRGAVLDERPGHRADPLLRRRARRARVPARALDGARLHARRARRRPARARLPTASRSRRAEREQDWKGYAKTVLVFSVALLGSSCTRSSALQGHLFLNPDHMKGVPPHIALNTAASFVTNTNWQFYGGEYTMSYLTQMAGLAVQNFVSAAVGMAVLAAVVRGIARRSSRHARQLLGRPLPVARLHPAAARRSSSR